MKQFSSIQGVLFDLDGVLYTGSTVIEGAIEAVNRIRGSHIKCRFVTNTSTLSLASLQHKINALGFQIPANEIISAPQAALRYLQKQPNPVCRLLLADDVKQDFSAFTQSDTEAEYIVVGDMGEKWSYQILNEVFNSLVNGAKLIAIHKNKFWQTEQGLKLDIGGFIHGLEYASGAQAMIIGKPSSDFFQIALNDMHLKAAEVAMIGDDIDSDIGGAQQAGLQGILVRTGKYRQHYVEASGIKPDIIINSIRELPELLLNHH
ncbi:phospholysine phosphohistidine inorganic pyrophosphate phosphatase [Methylophilaceae bacterium]|nr:phospholysine phosphohistidine inorganic pyrophosphate phosphatase [Methylophilaceae bacterium]